MGVEHGGYCVGCCWALMAALFALGVMSIGWMAFIAALIATEKLLPWQAIANRGIAVLLLVFGLAVAFAPEDVPGLTLPGSAEADQAMEAMGMEGEGAPAAWMAWMRRTMAGDGGSRRMPEARWRDALPTRRAQASSGPTTRTGSACSTVPASST